MKRFVPDHQAALRIFFSLYFALSSATWCIPRFRPLGLRLNFYQLFFLDDLRGFSLGLEVSFLGANLKFLANPPFTYIIFSLMLVACGIFASGRLPRVSATGILILLNLIAYSMAGRNISFDIMTYAFLGYWAGLFLAPRSELPWFLSLNTLGTVYSVAALSKFAANGLGWATPLHVGFILQLARLDFETQASRYCPPAFLLEFFSRPTVFSTLSLWAVLAVESLGVFVLFFGRYIWVFVLAILFLFLAMQLFSGIMFVPVFTMVVIMLIPWHRVRGEGDSPRITPALRRRAFGFSLLVLAASWFLPSSPERLDVALVWPFSRFNMFATTGDSASIYYFKDGRGIPVKQFFLSRDYSISPRTLNARIYGRFKFVRPNAEIGTFVCHLLRERERPESQLRVDDIVVWAKYVYPVPGAGLTQEDFEVTRCGPPAG